MDKTNPKDKVNNELKIAQEMFIKDLESFDEMLLEENECIITNLTINEDTEETNTNS